jgi:[protein-PII] uridylyltransferase
LKQFKQKTQVSINQDPLLHQSMIEIVTPDRPGLLAVVARVFMELEISLVSAKITTLGERVEDLFYVTDLDGKAITDEHFIEKIQDLICEELDQLVQQATG